MSFTTTLQHDVDIDIITSKLASLSLVDAAVIGNSAQDHSNLRSSNSSFTTLQHNDDVNIISNGNERNNSSNGNGSNSNGNSNESNYGISMVNNSSAINTSSNNGSSTNGNRKRNRNEVVAVVLRACPPPHRHYKIHRASTDMDVDTVTTADTALSDDDDSMTTEEQQHDDEEDIISRLGSLTVYETKPGDDIVMNDVDDDVSDDGVAMGISTSYGRWSFNRECVYWPICNSSWSARHKSPITGY